MKIYLKLLLIKDSLKDLKKHKRRVHSYEWWTLSGKNKTKDKIKIKFKK